MFEPGRHLYLAYQDFDLDIHQLRISEVTVMQFLAIGPDAMEMLEKP
jgi:hypothetical protein